MAERFAIETETAPRPESARDPFTLDIIKNALAAIADEMAGTVQRTARSFVVKEALDYSTALFGADGDLIAQGTCLPLHMGAMPYAVEASKRAFAGEMRPGDIYVMNDPWDGSTHLPDVVCVKPIFLDERLVGYAAVLAHQTDIGGRVAGGNASDSTEIYQEGLRLPPVRLYDAGEPSRSVFSIIERNVRVPETVLGDIRSEVSACMIGARQLLDLIDKYGLEEFEAYCQELLDYTERYTRSEIAKLPDGEYDFTDYIDDDGIDPGPITFKVKITVKGDHMVVDFDGTSPQVRGAINSVYPFTASAAWACVRSVLDANIPNNAGYFRPIEVLTPKRSIVNPDPPSPVAARGLAGFRIADTVLGALAQIVPDLVPASGGNSPDAGVSLGGYSADGKPFVYLEFLVGSWGGGPWRDGMDACTGIIVNYSNTPTELLESEQPLLVERYGFIEDSGGPGEYRGGLALERHLRFLEDEGTIQVRSDRRKIAPYGLKGGAEGENSNVQIRRADGGLEVQPSKFLTTIRQGDVLEIRLASGGGYGQALDRDAGRVLADVQSEKISLEHAAEAYGVVISGEPPAVDEAATERCRAELRAAADGAT
ncbi:MAG: hydantoinase B/oxoprolinase family protein [Alphaproteobacteria bacterium]|nr:hydantoinase B/oxoprolinase family protein [Alphaproteobacteria bacterium]